MIVERDHGVYDFHRGTTPLLISIPHAGTAVAGRDRAALHGHRSRRCRTPTGTCDQLYDFARDLGASIIKANYSRYVVDLNRSPDSASLYAANPTSPVCPTQTFGGEAIYMSGDEPDDRRDRARIDEYWRPYHERIATELARITCRARHGAAVGCALDRERDPESVRRRAAGVQSRHARRRELSARRSAMRCSTSC